jgi:hypothetical protein
VSRASVVLPKHSRKGKGLCIALDGKAREFYGVDLALFDGLRSHLGMWFIFHETLVTISHKYHVGWAWI